MKKSRLLEIIREEIAGALNEAGLGDQISALQKQKDALEKKKAPIIKQEADISKKIADLEKKEADAEVKSSATLEEDTLNEEPFISPSQYDIAYNKETGEVEKGILGKAIENAVNVIKSMGVESTPEISKIITAKKARTSPNSPPELISALTAIDNAVEAQGKTFDDIGVLKIVQKMASQPKSDLPDLSTYISGEKTFSDKLQRPQTEKAIDRILDGGKKSSSPTEKPESTGKKGRPAGSGKKKAVRTPGDDGFDKVESSDVDGEDKEATQNIGSDSTAKELGKKADVSKNPDFDRIRKGLQDKRKKSKDGILSPEDMKLAINIINTAKDKYKFNTTQVDSLRADIGL